MKYGVHLPNFGGFGSAQIIADWAKDAESVGWDGFFIWDHIARNTVYHLVDPWIALTAVAMNTERILFGPMVTPLPRRRPWQLARQTATLDQLSQGRLILGVGIGSSGRKEWDAFGEETDTRIRGQMLDESLEIITGLWPGEPFAFDGDQYQVQESQFLPTPYQNSRLPIWIAGNYPAKKPMRRAARWDGMFIHVTQDAEQRLDDFRASVQFVMEHRESSAPFDIVYIDYSPVGTTQGQMITLAQQVEAIGATWWLDNLSPWRFGRAWDEQWDMNAMHDWVMQGPPK